MEEAIDYLGGLTLVNFHTLKYMPLQLIKGTL